jgi:predicted dehydrogenase
MKRINVAVIGCGFIAETAHIPNLLTIPEGKLVMICDIDKKRLDYIGAKFNVNDRCSDFHIVLKRSDIDAVIVCTPTPTHTEIVLAAIEAGKHVFVEKPMTMSSSEDEIIIKAAEKHGVKLMVGYQMRFLPNHQKAKEIVRKGEIGDVFYAEAHSETLTIKPSEGILIDYAVHFIDLLRWYFDNTRIESVAALLHLNGDYETEATLILKFANGIIGRIGVFWLPEYRSWEAVDRYVKILGTKGKIITEQSGPTITLYREGSLLSRIRGPHRIMPKFALHPNIPLSEIAYRKELEHFFDCIIKDKEPVVSAYDDKIVLKVVEAAKESFKYGAFVRLQD